MIPAIFSRTYPYRPGSSVLAAVRADGFLGAQLNLVSLGMESLPLTLDEAALTAAKEEAGRLGLQLSALSGTYNMAHPDPAKRHAIRPRFENVLKAARLTGIPIVTLCTGSRDEADMWAEHPDNATPAAWADLRAELDWALEAAGRQGLVLAIEPEPGNVIRDAKVARHLLDEVRAPHLKINLDAANLIGREVLARQAGIVAKAVDLLGTDTVLAHAKDIDTEGRVVPPGQGAIDLPAFAAALRSAGFDGPLIAHGFEAADTALAAKAMIALCEAT